VSYDSIETSVEDASPVELYEFTLGATSYAYTSAEDDITISADVWSARAIKRGKVEEGPKRRSSDFAVTLPTTDPLAQSFLGIMPGVRVPMTVKRFHRGDTSSGGNPEVITIFSGWVLSANFSKNGKECKLTARHALANLGRIIPSRSYASQCSHILYDSTTCKVDDTNPAYRVSADAVVSQVGNVLTVSSIVSGGFADGDFASGYVEAIGTSDFRLIVGQTGNDLTLLTPFGTVPSTVNVFRGCPHGIEACHDDFSNVINFGGFAFVPTRNPYQSGVL